MGYVIPLKKRRRRYRASHFKFRLPKFSVVIIFILILGGVFNSNILQQQSSQDIYFTKCGSVSRHNCVVDGDTFYLAGQKIRVADIDTPETYGARCSYEANLGDRATRRFRELLNKGPFIVKPIFGRDKDRYGRKLRTIHRGNQSLGAILVSEGLARKWIGRRLPWCT